MKYPFLKFIVALNGLAGLACSFLSICLCFEVPAAKLIVYIIASILFVFLSIISFCFVSVLSDIEKLAQIHENELSNRNE